MKIKTILPVVAVAAFLWSCKSSETTDVLGNWIRRSDFNGNARTEAVSFAINNVNYVTTGYDGTNRLTDTWKLDTSQNTVQGGNWLQMADFPGVARTGAVAFTASGKGYVGTGLDANNVMYSDFYSYNPTTNTWSTAGAVAPFGAATPTGTAPTGAARYHAVAFAINNIGYVGTGYNNNHLKDFYSYSPVTNTWTAISGLAQTKRQQAMSFVVNNLGYVVGGTNSGNQVNDFEEYHPGSNGGTWVVKRKITNATDSTFDDLYTTIQRSAANALVIGGKVYLTAGSNGSALKSCWQWDPSTDLWLQQNDYPGSARASAVTIQLGNRGLFATGSNGSAYYDNFVEFVPGVALNSNDWQ